MCFLDRSYCSADCLTDTCSRHKGQLEPGGRDYDAYTRWSKGFPDDSGPVAFMDMREGCDQYAAPKP